MKVNLTKLLELEIDLNKYFLVKGTTGDNGILNYSSVTSEKSPYCFELEEPNEYREEQS